MQTLTLGMATHEDFHRTQFTIESARIQFGPRLTEILVIDNKPGTDQSKLLQKYLKEIPNARYVDFRDYESTFVKQKVFDHAVTDWVLIVDCHVLLHPPFVPTFIKYIDTHPDSIDLLQGPLIYNNHTTISTHFEPVWRGEMHGIWATDPRGIDPSNPPFDIPMQGCGMFAMRLRAWPGFNPLFRGFGGEEGYIHEKVRRHGGRTLCVPGLQWWHSFDTPYARSAPAYTEDKIRNFLLGHIELDMPIDPILSHFRNKKSEKQLIAMAQAAQVDLWQAHIVPRDRTYRYNKTRPPRSATVC